MKQHLVIIHLREKSQCDLKVCVKGTLVRMVSHLKCDMPCNLYKHHKFSLVTPTPGNSPVETHLSTLRHRSSPSGVLATDGNEKITVSVFVN